MKRKDRSESPVQPTAKPKPKSGRCSLRGVDGWKDVLGFEELGVRVAGKCNKKLPKHHLVVRDVVVSDGKVPGHLVTSTTSTETQIESAQDFWERLFSHWPQWRRELRSVIQRDEEKFIQEMLPKVMGARSWTTSLVYGEPKDFGRLPHPAGRNQDRILSMLPADVQNQIFASVATLTSD
ncbi:unnamed protein product [Durusdinium trenchii]|uniref:Uncharacterized protein n=1 Tax=Durusdinium trenchii TaxID=1381693 RepID=A0ABP0JIF4_9DINO